MKDLIELMQLVYIATYSHVEYDHLYKIKATVAFILYR